MNCKNLHNEIIFFLDGDLSEAKQSEVEKHLAECADCRSFAEELKLTLAIIEDEKKPEINPFFYTKVKAKLENSAGKQTSLFEIFQRRILQPAFFSLLLLAGIYSGIKIGGSSYVAPATQTISKAELIPYLNELDEEPIETFLMQ